MHKREERRGSFQTPLNTELPCRVLVVDDDPVCQKLVEEMLRQCHYDVTCCNNGRAALDKLRDQPQAFDLVLTDVYMPDMDGFKLLEHVGLELDLPVIMMSSNGETSVVLQGVTHGAVDFLIKPVRIEELRNLWQHVIRRRRDQVRTSASSGDDGEANSEEKRSADRKRKEAPPVSSEGLQPPRDSDESTQTKKARVVWTPEMHQQFVEAVQALGIDKAVPKKILELMPRSDLTRENVASHLQKYRAALKRGLQDPMGHGHLPPGMLNGGPGAMDLASQYMSGMNPAMLGQLPNPPGASHLLNGPMVYPASYLAACMRPQGAGFYPQGTPAFTSAGNPVAPGAMQPPPGLTGSLAQSSPLQHLASPGGTSQGLGVAPHTLQPPPNLLPSLPNGLHSGEAGPSNPQPSEAQLLWQQPGGSVLFPGLKAESNGDGSPFPDTNGLLGDPMDATRGLYTDGHHVPGSDSVDDMLSLFLK